MSILKDLKGKEYCNCGINQETEQCKLGYLKEDIQQALSSSLERLKKKRECYQGFPHECKKDPDSCDNKIDWQDVEEEFRL